MFDLFSVCSLVRKLWIVSNKAKAVNDKKKRDEITESVLAQTFAYPTSYASHPVPALAALTCLAFPEIVEMTWLLPWRSPPLLCLLQDRTELSFPRRSSPQFSTRDPLNPEVLEWHLLPSSLHRPALCFSSAFAFNKSYLHCRFRQMN